MADIKLIADVIITGTKTLMGDENVVKFFCGKYSDGTSRNLPDAIHGEFLSPKQKKKLTKKKKKKKNTKFKL